VRGPRDCSCGLVNQLNEAQLDGLHGEPPPRPDHQKTFRFLPRSCCKQVRVIDPEALVA
jgi:hypothetical protein